jgi:hypothetical protein
MAICLPFYTHTGILFSKEIISDWLEVFPVSSGVEIVEIE